jgi:Domain of unknown function (DUF4430)
MTGQPFSAIRRPVENESSKTCSACGPWWRLPLLLGLVLAAIVWSQVYGLREESAEEKKKDASVPIADGVPQQKVELTIDFGGGRQKNFEAAAWHNGMTVADAMNASPGLKVTQKGSDQSAFVTAIDGIENQGADGQNWTYSVNGQIADRSFAVYELRPGDRVLWTFGRRQ